MTNKIKFYLQYIISFFKHLSSDVNRIRVVRDFFIVNPSIWPVLVAFCLFGITSSTVAFFHYKKGGLFCLFFFIILLIVCATFWWLDLLKETQNYNLFTPLVQSNLKLGMILFIVSEVFFFFFFFLGFFS